MINIWLIYGQHMVNLWFMMVNMVNWVNFLFMETGTWGTKMGSIWGISYGVYIWGIYRLWFMI